MAADGTTPSTITITLKSANGNPVSGKTVTLTPGSGHSTITVVNGVSNASGQAIFVVTDATVETVTYTAAADSVTVTQTVQVSFVAGPASAANSTVTATPATVPADGTTTSTITVTLKDAAGNPVSGKNVTLAPGSGSSTISTASGVSSPSGVVLFTVNDRTPQTVTYTATDTTDSVTVTQTAAVNFTAVPPPNITTLPTISVAPGTQVTLGGTGFGSTQGKGTVWLGSAPGAVVSWTDSQIVATVASNARTGTAMVQQGGAWSNAPALSVTTALISGVSPAHGVVGTSVTISGSGFGSPQGNGLVWIGTANGVVQTWNDSQIVAVVATGAASGNVQVLQNRVMSNAVPFALDTPNITYMDASSGPVGMPFQISGTGFGDSPGTVLLGSVPCQVVAGSWYDTSVLVNVPATAVSGLVRVQRNGVLSNGKSFTVTTAGGSGLNLNPAVLNMVVGDTHTIQALSTTGPAVTGLAWTSSDTTVVSLSTDDPPMLTAVAPGHVTIRAGTATAEVTVWDPTVLPGGALPMGTVLWSNPGNGSGVRWIVPAVPSATGVADVFAFQNDGTVQAITSDGSTAWTAKVPGWQVFPDFQGGLVYWDETGSRSIIKLNGMNGQPIFASAPAGVVAMAVHTDGTVFAVAQDPDSGVYSVIGIDSGTGGQKFSIPIQYESWDDLSIIIGGDGYAYVPYGWRGSTADGDEVDHIRLLRVDSSGASNAMTIGDFGPYPFYGDNPAIFFRGMITNADTGILLMFGSGDGPQMAVTSGTAVSIVSAPQIPEGGYPQAVSPVLQAQDGSFFGSVGSSAMVAFDVSGNVRWTVPNEQPQIATADGGVIGASGITYDANGNATGMMGSLPTESWSGNNYELGSLDSILLRRLSRALTLWADKLGNPSGNSTAARITQIKLHVFQLNGTQDVGLTGMVEAARDIWSKQSNGGIALLWDHKIQQVDPCAIPGCKRGDLENLLDIQSYNDINYWIQLNYFLQHFPDRLGINVIHNATLPLGNAITLNMPLAQSPQLDRGTLSNVIVLPDDTKNVLGHEVGHVFGLEHVSNPLNLMCGTPQAPVLPRHS